MAKNDMQMYAEYGGGILLVGLLIAVINAFYAEKQLFM